MEVAIVIPTLNEEKAVGKVVEGFAREGFGKIYVVDGFSTDRTIKMAKKAGAKILFRERFGKGDAIRTALREIDADFYILVDGDGTYSPSDAKLLLKDLKEKKTDMVVGVRERKNIGWFNSMGNRLFNWFLWFAYGKHLKDTQSGYRVITKRLAKGISFTYDDFQVEAEITVESLEGGYRIGEVPVSYSKRIGNTKLNPLLDGWKIGIALVRFLRDYKPLKFFWSLSSASMAISLVFFYRVFIDFLETGKVKLIGSSLISGILFLLAIELFIAGLLADMVGRRLKKVERSI